MSRGGGKRCRAKVRRKIRNFRLSCRFSLSSLLHRTTPGATYHIFHTLVHARARRKQTQMKVTDKAFFFFFIISIFVANFQFLSIPLLPAYPAWRVGGFFTPTHWFSRTVGTTRCRYCEGYCVAAAAAVVKGVRHLVGHAKLRFLLFYYFYNQVNNYYYWKTFQSCIIRVSFIKRWFHIVWVWRGKKFPYSFTGNVRKARRNIRVWITILLRVTSENKTR